jgi:hypothetical protein
MKGSRRQFLWTLGSVAAAACAPANPRVEDERYRFCGSIPQAVLANYLSRSIALPGFWSHHHSVTGDAARYHADLRTLAQLGPKHASFVCGASWDGAVGCDADTVLAAARLVTLDLHAMDGDIIVGGACHETVGPVASTIRIPTWVFDEMRLPHEERTFAWERMVYSDGEIAAIDITQIESLMWYYFWSRSFIDRGVEHMHFGALERLARNDRPDFVHYRNLLARVRSYAARHARRGLLLISAAAMDEAGLDPMGRDP